MSGALYRATRDLDLAGCTEADAPALAAIVQEICGIPCPSDGLELQGATIEVEPILDRSEYHGFRVALWMRLGPARIKLQIDVGFGDAIEPPARDEEYPALLDGPAPHIRVYPREAVVAEKLHAMVDFGAVNTRYKDFYDVFALATHFSFSGPTLAQSIGKTFERRSTVIASVQPIALTPGFYAEPKRAAEWQRYLTRNALPGAPADFTVTGKLLQAFLCPPWRALAESHGFTGIWPPMGPWAAQDE